MDLGWLILVSLLLGLAAWLGFMWSVKSGQYEDPEGPKYRMLEDDDGEPPARPRENAPAPPPPADPAGKGRG